MKAHVRPLVPDDLDDVVELHRQGFGGGAPPAELRAYLQDVFFGHPWVDDTLPSLAYVSETGGIVGCLGSMPRPMVLDGVPIRAVVSHNFIVAPGQRDGLAAIKLMRAAMAQRPDLTLADGNATARKISEALGARTLESRSNRWFRVLRPGGLGLHLMREFLAEWHAPPAIDRAFDALSSAQGAVGRRWSGPRVRDVVPGERADARSILEVMERLTGHLSLRPIYSERTFSWLLDVLRRTRREQQLRLAVVRSSGEAIGWYVYYSRSGGVGRVLQLGADPKAQTLVMKALFADARSAGNVAVTGQSDPAWDTTYGATSCRMRRGRTSMLLRTPNRNVDRAFETSDVFLSRLEGEGWLHFGY